MRRAPFYSSSKVIGGRGIREPSEGCFPDLEEVLRRAEERRDKSGAWSLFQRLLRQCEISRSLEDGRRVHKSIQRTGLGSDVLLSNLLTLMYGRCGSVEDARAVFEGISKKTIYSWNAMIEAYTCNRKGKEAVKLFQKMRSEGNVVPNHSTLSLAMTACGDIRAFAEAQAIHAAMIKSRINYGVMVQTEIVNMYGKCGRIDLARKVFDGIAEKDVVAWNSMMTVYTQHGHFQEALDLYKKMTKQSVPDAVTFTIALSACSKIGAIEVGLDIHARSHHSCRSSIRLMNSMIAMYGKCDDLEMAKYLFEKMKEKKNVVSWTTIISAFVHHRQYRDALKFFERMIREGWQPDSVTYLSVVNACALLGCVEECKRLHSQIAAIAIASSSPLDDAVQSALIHMFVKCGSMSDARLVFEGVVRKGKLSMKKMKNTATWTAMIAACVCSGLNREAIKLYQNMEHPNEMTFRSVLAACGKVGDVVEGRKIHERIFKGRFGSNVEVLNAGVIEMYGRCGDVDSALAVFNGLDRRDLMTWTAVISGLVEHGRDAEAVQVYKRMYECGVQADVVTFVNVITACNRLGDWNFGKIVHDRVVAVGLKSDPRLQNVTPGNALNSD